jgi:integrase
MPLPRPSKWPGRSSASAALAWTSRPNYGSERTVYLSDELPVGRTRLTAHCAPGRAHKGGSLDGWFLLGENGNPPHQNSLGYWWRKTREAIGYPTPRLHDLRHLYASGLIAAGCDVVTAPCSLGHSSATITLNTYAHLWPSAQDRTRAASSRLFVDVTRVSDESLTNDQAA